MVNDFLGTLWDIGRMGLMFIAFAAWIFIGALICVAPVWIWLICETIGFDVLAYIDTLYLPIRLTINGLSAFWCVFGVVGLMALTFCFPFERFED